MRIDEAIALLAPEEYQEGSSFLSSSRITPACVDPNAVSRAYKSLQAQWKDYEILQIKIEEARGLLLVFVNFDQKKTINTIKIKQFVSAIDKLLESNNDQEKEIAEAILVRKGFTTLLTRYSRKEWSYYKKECSYNKFSIIGDCKDKDNSAQKLHAYVDKILTDDTSTNLTSRYDQKDAKLDDICIDIYYLLKALQDRKAKQGDRDGKIERNINDIREWLKKKWFETLASKADPQSNEAKIIDDYNQLGDNYHVCYILRLLSYGEKERTPIFEELPQGSKHVGLMLRHLKDDKFWSILFQEIPGTDKVIEQLEKLKKESESEQEAKEDTKATFVSAFANFKAGVSGLQTGIAQKLRTSGSRPSDAELTAEDFLTHTDNFSLAGTYALPANANMAQAWRHDPQTHLSSISLSETDRPSSSSSTDGNSIESLDQSELVVLL